MANKERGEVDIRLGKIVWTMRPAYGAIVAIEETTGRGIIDLTRLTINRGLRFTDAVAIIHAGILASEPARVPDLEEIAEGIIKVGLIDPSIFGPLSMLLDNILSGGEAARKARGEDKPKGEAKAPDRK